jgi:nucleotide-binding universal stress UspA family protein
MKSKDKSVLIAHDGSPLSGHAVGAAEPVLPAGTKVTLLHIDTSGGDDVSEVDATATRLEARGIEVAQRNEQASDAAEALLAAIDQNPPDLVLMGTHGRSGSGRFIRGSVAERVMRECSSPLMMINPSLDTPLPLRSVLVPLDASDNSFEVIAPLLELITGTDAHVTLLFVDSDDPTDTEEIRAKRREQRKSDIAEWFADPASQISSAGIDIDIRIEHGSAAETILRIADEPQYDLLAMTTHGRSGLARWAFGSVAEKVLSACEKPVLLKRIR